MRMHLRAVRHARSSREFFATSLQVLIAGSFDRQHAAVVATLR
jgi:hypothetical protein